jgi:hypothetical protein
MQKIRKNIPHLAISIGQFDSSPSAKSKRLSLPLLNHLPTFFHTQVYLKFEPAPIFLNSLANPFKFPFQFIHLNHFNLEFNPEKTFPSQMIIIFHSIITVLTNVIQGATTQLIHSFLPLPKKDLVIVQYQFEIFMKNMA